jgi:hypothetical protein
VTGGESRSWVRTSKPRTSDLGARGQTGGRAHIWAYPSVVAGEHGQAVAEEGIRESLELCSWYEDLWKLVPELDAGSLAACTLALVY